MAITTLDGYIGAAKQKINITKTAAATSVANQWHTVFDRAGAPGAGSLSIGNTSAGVVPTDLTTGFPVINSFGGGATGYLGAVEFANTVAGRLYLYDRLFHVGSVSMTSLATTTLASQPSYAARLPNTDYKGLEIWLEINTTVSATATTVAVTYTNQDGTAARSTGASSSLSGFITGRMVQLPLQAGDTGVQKIDSIIVGGVAASAGTVNVIVARPLWAGRVAAANAGDTHGIDRTGMPQIYADSALTLAIQPDSTSTGIPDIMFDIVNG